MLTMVAGIDIRARVSIRKSHKASEIHVCVNKNSYGRISLELIKY